MTQQITDWQVTQDDDYLTLCTERLSAAPLYWVEQFVTLINETTANWAKEPKKINDIGCCTGAFTIGLRDLAKANFDYQGYDISKTYLNVARQYFPHEKFDLMDIATTRPRKSDITVMSGTLEHIDEWQTALAHMCQSTSRFILMRTFLGHKHEMAYYYKPGAQSPYPIYQFTFQQMHEEAEKHGFSIDILRDKATDSIPKYLGCSITRTQYVCMLRARD
ncbi:MAG: class I SAM-dependent methyltransferase [Cohaesibacter sp.]|nr:class I SAM-dependent methyltransferase [Cohaesibacter sp.]